MNYTCAGCGIQFNSEWLEEEAQAERKQNGFDNVECCVVCNDCYNAAEPQSRGYVDQDR